MSRKTRKRTKKHGYFLIEVVRAIHDGEQEILQNEVCSALSQRYKLSISDSTASRIAAELRDGSLGRRWLMPRAGHGLRLFSEEETIANSSAIKALFVAKELIEDDDWVDHGGWKDACIARFDCASEALDEFVREFVSCGYVTEEANHDIRRFRLNPRRINRDSFYLLAAREANLRRRSS